MKKIRTLTLSVLVLMLLMAACSGTAAEPTAVPTTEVVEPTVPANTEVILATTTSTADSGLLDVLLPIFSEQTGYEVKMVAVGSGKALEMGEQGNADVLLVHAPAAEKELMASGFGSERYLVMHNDFIIVGPSDDPAGIKGTAKAADALAKLAAAQAVFVSRGDDSGTHKMELSLWKAAAITPQGEWYLETGQGMGDTLRVTSEKIGYTLTDRATYLAQKDTLQLEILVEGDASLLNVYHVIVVNPEKWPNINLAGAQAFAQFMIADDIQAMIATFGVDKYGQALFFPDADKTDADLGLE